MNTGITWDKLYQDAKDKFGHDLDETTLIRRANRLIDEIKVVNLPTQIRNQFISYCYQFERYALPTDYKTEGIISLRYDNRVDNNRDRVYVRDEEPFGWNNRRFSFLDIEDWNSKEDIDIASIYADKGQESLWLKNGRADQVKQEISLCDSLTEWTGSAGASNLTLDSNVKQEGDYSINYDVSGTAPILTLNLTTAIDLDEYINNGIIRLFKWLPTVPSSIVIKIGEDSSNYYTQTISTQADGLLMDNENVNEIEFSFKDATLTGTPDMSNVLYFEITLNFATSTTDTDFRIDNIVAYKPEQLVFEYYSFYLVKDENNAWAEYLTDGMNESINILPEWRKQFVKGLLLEEMDKTGDKRLEAYEKSYTTWLDQISRKWPNKSKKIGSFYY